ncbi:MAG: DNA mismatch endonuclease Vsr [Bacteroidaceae bacterium]|nr:DNA mismatch endonuclease Vsr [Bacteroidaceae bacterium]
MDKMTPHQRHNCMSRIRGKATKPELRVRNWLWHHGYRYRLNVNSVPGKPDIVLRRYRTAIFVNGCYWHGHDGCSMFTVPKCNTEFWITKISHNKERDQRNYKDLQDAGWHVIVVWECQLKKGFIEETMRGVEHTLSQNLLNIYKD